jgi:hypothetical protein
MNNGWLKVRSVVMGGAILGLIGFATVAKISATATYDYKPGQFLVIDGGKSPDKQFAIVSGEDKSGNFGVQLMDAKTKKLIGPLEEVATELDSAPDAYRAHWSPDSKHVGISSREDRHLLRNVIYRIENRRAYLVETPQLLCHAVPDFCQLQKELSGALKWLLARARVVTSSVVLRIVRWSHRGLFKVSTYDFVPPTDDLRFSEIRVDGDVLLANSLEIFEIAIRILRACH